MNSAVINIKTTPETKARAHEIARDLGFNLSSLMNAYLNQLIRTQTIQFSVVDEKPSKALLAMLKESQKNMKEKQTSPTFETGEEAIAWLHNRNRKYEG